MNMKELYEKSCKLDDKTQTREQCRRIFKHGIPKGTSTGWRSFDKYFTLLKGQLNILTGFPGSGKSEWIEAMACNLAKRENWNTLFFSPENYPIEFHKMKLVEKIMDRQCHRKLNFPELTADELEKGLDFVDSNFSFIDAGTDDYNLDSILFTAQHSKLIMGKKTDMVIIDPWNELEVFKPSNMTETEYIGESLKRIRKFARLHNISFWIVAHPAKIGRKKDGNYPSLSMYDISGSQHWYNKADNGIIIERNYENGMELIVKANVKKIKNRHYGKIGEAYFEFIPGSGNYRSCDESVKPPNKEF
jgi:twinkle protein